MRSKTKHRVRLVGLALMLWNSPSPAADEPEQHGYYVGAGGLAALEDFDSSIDFTPLRLADSSESFGVSVWAGRRFGRVLAAEGEFNWLEGFDVRLDRGHFGNPHADLDGWMMSANAKAILPLGRIQPFAKFGMGVLHASLDTEEREHLSEDRSDDDFIVRMGGGVALYATRAVCLLASGEYVLPVGALERIPFVLINLGLQIQF